MNIMKPMLPLALILCAVASGCSPKKPASAEQREKWLESLNDSISAYQRQIELVNEEITDAHNDVGAIIGQFEYVNNPREVEGYYIFNGWKERYPLKSTGLVARVNESEGFELIAALANAHFNEIGITSDGITEQSDVVPHDQALNYRAGNLNTVCFSGAKADSIGEFIASHENGNITVSFLNGGKTGSKSLSDGEKKMIAETWRLYSSQKKLHSLEKELPRLSGRISACRRMLEGTDSVR